MKTRKTFCSLVRKQSMEPTRMQSFLGGSSGWIVPMLCWLFIAPIQSARCQVPETMSFQGILTDGSGNNIQDGTYTLTFRLYDAAVGGVAIWSEAQSVSAQDGIFNVLLGTVTPLAFAFDRPYWLGITVNNGTEMTPRTALTSSPYSLSTRSISGATVRAANISQGQVVKSVNSLTDQVTLAAGDNIAISANGNTISISATGIPIVDGYSLDSADGSVTDALIVSDTGNVGIGTLTPFSKLEVAGTIHASEGGFKFPDGTVQTSAVDGHSLDAADGTPTDALLVNNNGNVAIGYPDPGPYKLAVDGDTWIQNKLVVVSGNVGIGTLVPQGRLQIQSNSLGTGTISSNGTAVIGSGTSFTTQLAVGDYLLVGGQTRIITTITDDANLVVDSAFATDLAVGTAFSFSKPRFIVKESGNVGIGTTSPLDKLSVAGTVASTSGGFKFPDGTIQSTAVMGDGHTLDAADGTPTDALFVDNNGNVGIGTVLPNSRVHINGDGNSPSLRVQVNGVSKLTVAANGGLSVGLFENSPPIDGLYVSGNVGIGTSAPQGRLQIQGNSSSGTGTISSNGTVVTGSDTSFTTQLAVGDNIFAAVQTRVVTAITDDLHLTVVSAFFPTDLAVGTPYSFSKPRFIVKESGNVGIGTTSPLDKLSVAGTVASTSGGFKFPDGTIQSTTAAGDGYSLDAADGTPTDALFVNNSGNVGIGTSFPLDKVDIQDGNIRLTGADSSRKVIIEAKNAEGVGRVFTYGPSGTANVTLNYLAGYPDHGFLAVHDSNGDIKVGVYANALRNGSIFLNDRLGITKISLNSEGVSYLNGGDVGIGTVAPQGRLQIQSNAVSGIGTINSNGIAVTGSGTSFTTQLAVGDSLLALGQTRVVTSITDNISLAVSSAFAPDLSAGTQFSFSKPRFVVRESGNVGIGTTNPSARLEIGGTPGVDGVRFPDGTLMTTAGVGSSSNLANATDAVVNADADANASGVVRLQIGGSDKLFINNAGNIGIGTNNPDIGKLQINAASNGVVVRNGTNTDASSLGHDGIRSGYIGDDFFVGASKDLYLRTYVSDWLARMIIKNDGNIGIGTLAPQSKLDVAGTVTATAFVGDGSGLTGLPISEQWTDVGDYIRANNATNVVIRDSGNVGIGFIDPIFKLAVNGDTWTNGTVFSEELLVSTTSNNYGIRHTDGSVTVGTWIGAGRGQLGTKSNHPLDFFVNNSITPSMTIGINGNVGIATTTPSVKLEVVGTVKATAFVGDGSGLTGISGSGLWSAVTGGIGYSGGNVGIGTSAPQSKLDVAGTTRTAVLQITGGADLSENFDVNQHSPEENIRSVEPGTVVCIDPLNPGELVVCTEEYDRKVAGIISGAGGINSGMTMGQTGSQADGNVPVALSGRVYCMADAASAAILPGDLLTTSSVPGHAMKATQYERSQGAILGKAMTGLDSGRGMVLVLVALQ